MNKVIISDLILLIVTFAWAYTYIATKWVLWEVGEFYFLSLRFLIASAIMLLFLLHKLEKFNLRNCLEGFLCGSVLAGAFYCQILGLKISSPGTSGMITGLFVVIVPFLYFFFSKKPLQLASVIGSFLAFSGLILFSQEENSLQEDSLGEVFLFFGAVLFAAHIVLLDRAYRKIENLDPQIFAFLQVFVVGSYFVYPALTSEDIPWPISSQAMFGFWYDVLIGTVIAYTAQTTLQKYSPPTHISLILSFESVFAFFFSWWFYGEIITIKVILGAFLMVLGILVTELLEKHKFKLKGKFKLWESQKKL